MGCLIVTTIAAILAWFDIITTNVFIGIVIASLAWIYIGAGLYFAFGWLKFFYHDFLEWHRPDDSPETFDGCSIHCRCKHCGKDIMQDSQGNWF